MRHFEIVIVHFCATYGVQNLKQRLQFSSNDRWPKFVKAIEILSHWGFPMISILIEDVWKWVPNSETPLQRRIQGFVPIENCLCSPGGTVQKDESHDLWRWGSQAVLQCLRMLGWGIWLVGILCLLSSWMLSQLMSPFGKGPVSGCGNVKRFGLDCFDYVEHFDWVPCI